MPPALPQETKFAALWLVQAGVEHDTIIEVLELGAGTLYRWKREVREAKLTVPHDFKPSKEILDACGLTDEMEKEMTEGVGESTEDTEVGTEMVPMGVHHATVVQPIEPGVVMEQSLLRSENARLKADLEDMAMRHAKEIETLTSSCETELDHMRTLHDLQLDQASKEAEAKLKEVEDELVAMTQRGDIYKQAATWALNEGKLDGM